MKTRDFKPLSLHIDARSVAANPVFSYSSQKKGGVFFKKCPILGFSGRCPALCRGRPFAVCAVRPSRTGRQPGSSLPAGRQARPLHERSRRHKGGKDKTGAPPFALQKVRTFCLFWGTNAHIPRGSCESAARRFHAPFGMPKLGMLPGSHSGRTRGERQREMTTVLSRAAKRRSKFSQLSAAVLAEEQQPRVGLFQTANLPLQVRVDWVQPPPRRARCVLRCPARLVPVHNLPLEDAE